MWGWNVNGIDCSETAAVKRGSLRDDIVAAHREERRGCRWKVSNVRVRDQNTFDRVRENCSALSSKDYRVWNDLILVAVHCLLL